MNYLLSTKIKLEPLIGNCLNSIKIEMFLLYLFSLKRILPEFALDDLAFVECVFLWWLGVLDLFGGLTLFVVIIFC